MEAAISEKDAHLALLEMSGIRTERQASDVDKLKKDKKRLMERLKREVIALFLAHLCHHDPYTLFSSSTLSCTLCPCRSVFFSVTSSTM